MKNKEAIECMQEAEALSAAIERGGWDVSPCSVCGELVVCVPDGLALCEPCGNGEVMPGEQL